MRIDIRDSKYSVIYNEKTGAPTISVLSTVCASPTTICPLQKLWIC